MVDRIFNFAVLCILVCFGWMAYVNSTIDTVVDRKIEKKVTLEGMSIFTTGMSRGICDCGKVAYTPTSRKGMATFNEICSTVPKSYEEFRKKYDR